MNNQEILVNNILSIRKKTGYTQQNIADYLDVTQAAYSKYETGELEIPIKVIEKLSILFGVDEFDFFEQNEDIRLSNLALSFRADSINNTDIKSIAKFKKIVKNYIIMSNELDKK